MASSKTNRRNLLKVMGMVPAAITLAPLAKIFPSASKSSPHIIIVVCDAWTANNTSLYGYPRPTTVNIERFAKRSTVFNHHYSAGNFTVPGTASLLTGTFPWTHRAMSLGGLIKNSLAEDQIFKAVSATHKGIGFAQNVYADQLINQAGRYLDTHIPFGTYHLQDSIPYDSPLFNSDAYTAFSSFEEGIFKHGKGMDGSIFLGPLARLFRIREKRIITNANGEGYYESIPESYDPFLLSDVVDGLIGTLEGLTEPSIVYFHMYSPHDPYRPYAKHFNGFRDDEYAPKNSPTHPLVPEPQSDHQLRIDRLNYDAFLASLDQEMDRLFGFFDTSGLKENSYIFLTSDHGEMFDHGLSGHMASLLFEPLIHIPLIVSAPGQFERHDVDTPTSSVDVLPTICHITKNEIPDWSEGRLLPTLGGESDPERAVFSFSAPQNSSFGNITQYSISMVYKNNKLIKYNHPKYSKHEFYDLLNDPQEKLDLSDSLPEIGIEMVKELDKLLPSILTMKIPEDGNK